MQKLRECYLFHIPQWLSFYAQYIFDWPAVGLEPEQ